MKLFIEYTSNNAYTPERGSNGAAGYDIRTPMDFSVEPFSRVWVSTNIKIGMPTGVYARIAPRSGLALKGVDIGGGIIDQDYRGEIKVIVINSTSEEKNFEEGDKIAQIIFQEYKEAEFVHKTLDTTSRGGNGFGSTDMQKPADVIYI